MQMVYPLKCGWRVLGRVTSEMSFTNEVSDLNMATVPALQPGGHYLMTARLKYLSHTTANYPVNPESPVGTQFTDLALYTA